MHSKVLIAARPAIYTLGIHNTTHLLYFNLFGVAGSGVSSPPIFLT